LHPALSICSGEDLLDAFDNGINLLLGYGSKDDILNMIPLQFAKSKRYNLFGLETHDALVEQLNRVDFSNESIVLE
jgi:hypothetical protein